MPLEGLPQAATAAEVEQKPTLQNISVVGFMRPESGAAASHIHFESLFGFFFYTYGTTKENYSYG